jgi:hypothetical protein
MAPQFNPELNELFLAVNMQVNWRAIVTAGSYISRARLSSTGPLTLSCALVPWFIRNDVPVCHDPARQYPGLGLLVPERGDSIVTVDGAATPGFRHPWMSEERIRANRPKGPVKLKLPAYDVERGYLLLDGVHRSIATLRAGIEYEIELAVIRGPIDRHVLPDLAVFEP